MEQVKVTATFGPASGDRTTLSKTARLTLDALYQHPLSHNLEWPGVVALFEKIGTVDHKSHNIMTFNLGGEHHRVHKPHNKDLTAAEVMAFRHILSRNGWAPQTLTPLADTGAFGPEGAPDFLVVVDHHAARLYRLDIRSADLVDHVITPHDPHHLLHHLSHKDHPREHGQRTPEDHDFYERIAQAVMPAGAIVLIGHGKGHSNAAQHLTEYLHQRHLETFKKVVCEVVADLSSVTPPQLLGIGRHALVSGTPPATIERPAP